jgi:hypothetical protein
MVAARRSRLGLPCLVVLVVVTLLMSRSTAAFQQPPHIAASRLSRRPRPFGAAGCGAVAFQQPEHFLAHQRRSSGIVAFAAADSSSTPVKTPPPPAAYKPKVWAYYRSRSKIIEWYMQELGVVYDAVQIDMGTMGHKDPTFLRDVNPFGKHAWGEVGKWEGRNLSVPLGFKNATNLPLVAHN